MHIMLIICIKYNRRDLILGCLAEADMADMVIHYINDILINYTLNHAWVFSRAVMIRV